MKRDVKAEKIHAHLERDIQRRTLARYAMREAEEAFKLASGEYDSVNAEIDGHLLDYAEALGYERFYDSTPAGGFAQFDET